MILIIFSIKVLFPSSTIKGYSAGLLPNQSKITHIYTIIGMDQSYHFITIKFSYGQVEVFGTCMPFLTVSSISSKNSL